MAGTQTLQKEAVFGRGVALGREYADLASRRLAAWAEENPGQLLLAGLAAGFVLGKLIFRKPRIAVDERC
jgi:hypothetical protein